MNCVECSLAIEAGVKIIQMPCCDLTYHSQCGINRLFSGGYYHNVECVGCGNHLHDSPYYSSGSSSNVTSIEEGNALLDGAAKPDLKKLKEKSREVSAARKEFDTHLKEEFVAFQEMALPQLEGIKALKDARMSAVKQSPEYKGFNSKKMAFSQMFAKFQKKYPTIPRSCLRQKIGTNCFNYRYSSSLMMLRRKFRLRKWYR
jgi:hypothetical protein